MKIMIIMKNKVFRCFEYRSKFAKQVNANSKSLKKTSGNVQKEYSSAINSALNNYSWTEQASFM